ncbi:hypothetical protein M2305_002222 [Gluconobacter cerinus]|uniref:hypothetical protein n=1 Tax=Gluconobacter cerinus TaxID=38307 RepID=UPI002227EE41|nr:hypothetical protein [Gluconobacter cerinus]MCW2266275.1 hypothetical protein [Gluconobacter cerinus]
MTRPSLDYDRLAPAVRRLHAGGSSVRAIAEYVGISPRSVTSMIVRLDLPRRRKSTSVRRRVSRAALPVGAGLEVARV